MYVITYHRLVNAICIVRFSQGREGVCVPRKIYFTLAKEDVGGEGERGVTFRL
jgi:hypothetical protein